MKQKNTKTILLSAGLLLGIFCNTQAQSNIARIIPGGIWSTEGSYPQIHISTGSVLEHVHPDDWISAYTGFGIWQWMGEYTFSGFVDGIGFRAFNVKRNDVFSWEKIKSGIYKEVENVSVSDWINQRIVYLGIYTGTSPCYDEYDGYPPGNEHYGYYPDPLFCWVKLKFNEDGSYKLMSSAMGYKCKGIIVGTEELIVPTISSKIEGQTMTLTYSDSLYESEDAQNWTEVSDAEDNSTYTVDISQIGRKFYTSIYKEHITPTLRYYYFSSASKPFVIIVFKGKLQESTDGIHWTDIDAEGQIEITPGEAASKFYRAVSK